MSQLCGNTVRIRSNDLALAPKSAPLSSSRRELLQPGKPRQRTPLGNLPKEVASQDWGTLSSEPPKIGGLGGRVQRCIEFNRTVLRYAGHAPMIPMLASRNNNLRRD